MAVTKKLVHDSPPAELAEWMKWKSSMKQTESGEISFLYTQLTPLKNGITPALPQLEFSKKVRMISLSKEYETDIITMFHATGDFNYRSRRQEGVKAVEEIGHFLPRIGMRCRCVMENGEVIIYASGYSYSPERIEFSETDENKKNSTYYLLETTDNNKTRLTLDFYIRKNITEQITFRLIKKKKLEKLFQKSLLNLEELVKEIKLPPITENSSEQQ